MDYADHVGDQAAFYHRHPTRHPRFVGSATGYYNSTAAMQSTVNPTPRPSNRWSTEPGTLTPPSGHRASALAMDSSSPTGPSSAVVGHSAAVESFFAFVRVPASFLAATSFSELFSVEVQRDDTTLQRQLQTFCLICQGVSFVLSMNVIMLTTQALTRALTGDFDPFAETGYEFLFREFHFEFVCVRWSFIVSLYGFLLAVTAKILYGFELFNVEAETFERSYLELGIGVTLVMASLMIHLHSYVNRTLVGWSTALGT